MKIDKQKKNTGSLQIEEKVEGVVIGLFLSINDSGEPLVAFPGNPVEAAVPAHSTTQFTAKDIGKEVALLFEGGDLLKPLIIGKIQQATAEKVIHNDKLTTAEMDGDTIVLSANKEIVLKCGKSSITLTQAGKILIKGEYLSSRSTGVNRIKGGSIQLN